MNLKLTFYRRSTLLICNSKCFCIFCSHRGSREGRTCVPDAAAGRAVLTGAACGPGRATPQRCQCCPAPPRGAQLRPQAGAADSHDSEQGGTRQASAGRLAGRVALLKVAASRGLLFRCFPCLASGRAIAQLRLSHTL